MTTTICFCFGHTLEEIEDQVARTGSCDVADSIAEQCRQGLQRCEETNPKGHCCLGDVRRATRESLDRHGEPSAVAAASRESPCGGGDPACCDVEPGSSRQAVGARRGSVAAAAAVVVASLSSACCWLPLVMLGLGVSTAGFASWIEPLRGPLLLLTAVFLLVAFVLTRRDAANPVSGVGRMARPMLWGSAAVAVMFAAYPSVTTWLDAGPPGLLTAPLSDGMAFDVDGMTCASCATGLQSRLASIPGVREASVSYPDRQARVWTVTNHGSAQADVLLAIREAGYQGRRNITADAPGDR